MLTKPEKIISGGQTGADLAGLDAAAFLGIPTGGTAPKGWRICLPDGSDGSDPSLAELGLVEHSSAEYPPRTKKNIEDAHGTAWFGYVKSNGAKLTIGYCNQLAKPIIFSPSSTQLRAWVSAYGIKVLNVAGNRLSDFNSDIYEKTYLTIAEAFGAWEQR